MTPIKRRVYGEQRANIKQQGAFVTPTEPKQSNDDSTEKSELSDNQVVVNWGVDEAHTLKNLNINVPSPIQGRYDWPGQHKPYDHQKSTAAFLTMNRRAFCFNEQGTGKTGFSYLGVRLPE